MNVSILGSTGSIGTQTLEVCENLGYKIKVLTANSDAESLERQIRLYKPDIAVLVNAAAAGLLRDRTGDCGVRILSGEEGLLEAAAYRETDTVVNGITGVAGLHPSLEVLRAGKRLALANKESLVVGGRILMDSAKKNKSEVIPVDSEHSAIFQVLQGKTAKPKRIILTASGGPFAGKSYEELSKVTVKDVLQHPVWKMGNKITVDCANLMNKGLEVIEAMWLFDLPIEKIDVIIHRQSIVHSIVEFEDNSMIAQLSTPDMKLPIQYAMTYPDRLPSLTSCLDLAQIGQLTFEKPDLKVFRGLDLCIRAVKKGGTACAVLNAANEAAVGFFLEGKIKFTEIIDAVEYVLEEQNIDYGIDAIKKADEEARAMVSNFFTKRKVV